jgi:hypothetical protein
MISENRAIAIFLIAITIGLIAGNLEDDYVKYNEGFVAGHEAGLDLMQQSIVTGLVKWTSMEEVAGGYHSVDYVMINHGNWTLGYGWWDWDQGGMAYNETFQIESYLKENFKNGTLIPSDTDFSTSTEQRGYNAGSYYRI